MNSRVASLYLRQAGVTLVELIVVISIAAILTAIGVPSYRYVTTSNRISGEINDLMGDLQFARYEAIKEGLTVTVCPAASASMAATCDVTTTWTEGWIVLSNANIVLRRHLSLSSINAHGSDSMTGSTSLTSVGFNREGFAVLPSGATNPMFSLHDPNNQSGYTRCLMISGAGAMSTATNGNAVYSALQTCS
jgi:type IV fimbrial biogenesis protein FimT